VVGTINLSYGPFYRIETDEEVMQLQVQSREMWGKARRNSYQGLFPAVKAYEEWIGGETSKGIKFTTDVPPDPSTSCILGQVQWSGERLGVRIEDGYAKIKVLDINYYP
jgi:hypothetical protein